MLFEHPNNLMGELRACVFIPFIQIQEGKFSNLEGLSPIFSFIKEEKKNNSLQELNGLERPYVWALFFSLNRSSIWLQTLNNWVNDQNDEIGGPYLNCFKQEDLVLMQVVCVKHLYLFLTSKHAVNVS